MFQAQNQTLRIQQKPDREFPGLLALLSYRKETDVANKQGDRDEGGLKGLWEARTVLFVPDSNAE